MCFSQGFNRPLTGQKILTQSQICVVIKLKKSRLTSLLFLLGCQLNYLWQLCFTIFGLQIVIRFPGRECIGASCRKNYPAHF